MDIPIIHITLKYKEIEHPDILKKCCEQLKLELTDLPGLEEYMVVLPSGAGEQAFILGILYAVAIMKTK